MDPSSDADRLWRAAQALNRAATAVSPEAGRLPPLLFFTDPERTPRPWETAARLPAGAGVVWRAFGRADALDEGLRLRAATRASGVMLLVGLDADLAEAVEADGLHLPESAQALAPAVRARNPGWRLTGARHAPRPGVSGAGWIGPELSALDAVVLSPVFPAGGVSAARPALGIEAFSRLAHDIGRPVYALGGVGPDQAEALASSTASGAACGIAAVSAVQAAFARL